MLRPNLWIFAGMQNASNRRRAIDNHAADVALLEAFYVRDSGHAEAVTLTFEVEGMAVEVLLREAIPVGKPRDLHMRAALTHVCGMLIGWANFGDDHG